MPAVHLTPREEQVLRHVQAGESNKEIAEDLGISEQAVKALVSRLLLKFQVSNRTTLAAEAGRAVGDAGPRRTRTDLLEALRTSRDLRQRNRDLLDQLRVELRQLRGARRQMLDRRRTEGP